MSQTLSDKLAAFKAAFIQRAPEQIRHVIQQANDDLRASGVLDRSVKVGDQLSAFELPNQDGAIIRSDDLLARGPLVLSFFRGVWCPYCNLELEALGEIAGDLRARRQFGGDLAAKRRESGGIAREKPPGRRCIGGFGLRLRRKTGRVIHPARAYPNDLSRL